MATQRGRSGTGKQRNFPSLPASMTCCSRTTGADQKLSGSRPGPERCAHLTPSLTFAGRNCCRRCGTHSSHGVHGLSSVNSVKRRQQPSPSRGDEVHHQTNTIVSCYLVRSGPGREPLVSGDLFNRVQDVFAGRNKPKHRKHAFAFAGLLKCSNDGCTVTAELQKGKYVYYRCSHGRGKTGGNKSASWKATCRV